MKYALNEIPFNGHAFGSGSLKQTLSLFKNNQSVLPFLFFHVKMSLGIDGFEFLSQPLLIIRMVLGSDSRFRVYYEEMVTSFLN